MKTLLKLTTGIALVVLAAACQKEKAASTEVVKEKISLAELWEKMNAPSDPSGDAATLAIYSSLTAKELEEFTALRLQKDSLQLAKKIAADNNGRVSAAQEVTIGLQLKKTKTALATLEQEASAKFNKQTNQLSNTEISELLALHQGKAGDVSVMACPLVSFPYVTSGASTNGKRAYGYYSIGNSPGPDCDWEFRFDGSFWKVYGANLNTRLLLGWYGSAVSRRIIYFGDGYDTGVLLGWWATSYFTAGPTGVAIDGLN